MGNWRTVYIIGKCRADEVDALRQAVCIDFHKEWDRFHCLCYSGPSLCGLTNWPAERINAVGNLAERDYSVEDVAASLRNLIKIAPSLDIKIHCGGDWEAKQCIATVQGAGGKVAILEPEITILPAISEIQMLGQFFRAVTQAKSAI